MIPEDKCLKCRCWNRYGFTKEVNGYLILLNDGFCGSGSGCIRENNVTDFITEYPKISFGMVL